MLSFTLSEEQLWSDFDRISNEMIITKHGRCLFPLLRFNVNTKRNSDPPLAVNKHPLSLGYGLAMIRLDGSRWKFKNGKWIATCLDSTKGTEKIPIVSDPVKHLSLPQLQSMHVYEPIESPQPLQFLRKEGISFAKVKLTNQTFESLDEAGKRGEDLKYVFSLNSFCHYQPVLLWCFSMFPGQRIQSVLETEPQRVNFCFFEGTQFIAVTHYQNEQITSLKKAYNPHAKGFLTSSALCTSRQSMAVRYVNKDNTPSDIDEDEYLASKALEKLSSASASRAPSRPSSPVEGALNFHDETLTRDANESAMRAITMPSGLGGNHHWSWHRFGAR